MIRCKFKCADECINKEGKGLPVTLITGTKEHTPRPISHYIGFFFSNSYSHTCKDAILSTVVISEVFFLMFLNNRDYF